jgi:hypothetical protein
MGYGCFLPRAGYAAFFERRSERIQRSNCPLATTLTWGSKLEDFVPLGPDSLSIDRAISWMHSVEHKLVHFEHWTLQLAVEDSFQLIVGVDVEAYAPGYIVQDMAQQEQPGPDRPREESDAFSRQSKALNEIDEAIRSDEPAGEKLKKLVEEHGEACDEIKEELAGHKEGTMPQSSPLSE